MLSSWGLQLRNWMISRVRRVAALRIRILNSRGGRLETATLPSSSGSWMVKVSNFSNFVRGQIYYQRPHLSKRKPNDDHRRRHWNLWRQFLRVVPRCVCQISEMGEKSRYLLRIGGTSGVILTSNLSEISFASKRWKGQWKIEGRKMYW